MPYYTAAGDDEVHDFDEFDPTPYGGGFDLFLTYGRALEPSDETCYPNSSPSDDFDYERPQFSSHSEPSAYADEALDNEYSSYARPTHRPGPAIGFTPGGGDPEGEHGGRPQPAYGFQPGGEDPSMDPRGPIRVMGLGMVGSRGMNSPVRIMVLGIDGDQSPMSPVPSMDLGMAESPSTRRLNPSMDLGTGESPSTRLPNPSMDLDMGESLSSRHRELDSGLGMIGSRVMARSLVMEMSRRESQAMGGPVMRPQKVRRGPSMRVRVMGGLSLRDLVMAKSRGGGLVMRPQKARRGPAMGGLATEMSRHRRGPAMARLATAMSRHRRGPATARLATAMSSHRRGLAMARLATVMSRHHRGPAMGGPVMRGRKARSMRSPVMGGAGVPQAWWL